MTLETFYEHFELLADAPNAVPKLREMVLQLAVQGKLTEPEPSDEQITTVMKTIRAEKLRLVESRVIRSTAQLPVATAADLSFPLPENWIPVRLDEVGTWGSGGTPRRGEAAYYGGDIPWLVIGDLNDDFVFSAQTHITELGLKNSSAVLLEPNTLLIAMYGSIGKLGITGIQCATNQAIAFCKPFSKVDLRFLFYAFRESRLRLTGEGKGLAQQNISQTVLKRFVIALPSLEEQKRIVAKVDELMALCDDLEQQQRAKAESRSRLNTVFLTGLSSAPDEPSFKRAWELVASGFDMLYSTPETIGDLRKTILQLAVQGKLVRQDPRDEPAEKLLERIAVVEQKRKVANAGSDAKVPFTIPRSWQWATFNQVGTLARGKSKHRPRNDPLLYANGTYRLIQTGDVARAKNGIVSTWTALYNDAGLAQSRLWPKGTMCITIAANIADTALLGFDACFPDSVVGFTPSPEISNARYFDFFMRTAKEQLQDFAPSTAQKNINLAILDTVSIPIPPKAEVDRIVVKVDELMALVDELETGLKKAQVDAERLLEGVISTLLSTEPKQAVEA